MTEKETTDSLVEAQNSNERMNYAFKACITSEIKHVDQDELNNHECLIQNKREPT